MFSRGSENRAAPARFSEPLTAEGIRRYVGIPPGTVDFLVWLYRLVRFRTLSPAQPPPTAFPPGPRPSWVLDLDPAEQRLIDHCLVDRSLPDVDLLYLHAYARLTVGQMALALYRSRPGAGDVIIHQPEACWDDIL